MLFRSIAAELSSRVEADSSTEARTDTVDDGVSTPEAVSETEETKEATATEVSAVEPVSAMLDAKLATAATVSAVDAVSDTDAVNNPPPSVARGSWANAAFPNIY